jgi:hypothetical protein
LVVAYDIVLLLLESGVKKFFAVVVTVGDLAEFRFVNFLVLGFLDFLKLFILIFYDDLNLRLKQLLFLDLCLSDERNFVNGVAIFAVKYFIQPLLDVLAHIGYILLGDSRPKQSLTVIHF